MLGIKARKTIINHWKQDTYPKTMLGVRTFNANQVDAVAYDIAYHCLSLPLFALRTRIQATFPYNRP